MFLETDLGHQPSNLQNCVYKREHEREQFPLLWTTGELRHRAPFNSGQRELTEPLTTHVTVAAGEV